MLKYGAVVDIVQISIMIFCYMALLLIICHFGGNITKQFEEVGDVGFQLSWYNLPLDIQKDLLLIIYLAQKQIYLRGFGDTRTTHTVFKKVCMFYERIFL